MDEDTIKYYAKKVYKYDGEKWVEINYTDTNYVNGQIEDVKDIGEKLAKCLGFENTEIGENYIISPAIGGGYLNIVGAENGSKVIIDPNGIDPNNDKGYIFLINNGTTNTLMIDNQGNANFEGSITMNSGTISWDKVADNGAYSLASSASSSASTALDDILYLAKGEYTKDANKTFIHGKGIYSPTIVGAEFYATEGDKKIFSKMSTEGFEIYRGATDIPKMTLMVSNDTVDGIESYGSRIRLTLGAGGAGAGSGDNWTENNRFILEKCYSDEKNYARMVYYNGGIPIGFVLSDDGVELVGATTIKGLEGVEGGTAVFG